MPVRRLRRCPSCRAVLAGGQLKPVRYGSHWHAGGYDKRRCPRCGKVASTRDFALVKTVGTATVGANGSHLRMVQVGDTVFHPDGTPLEVVDVKDSALLVVRFPTGTVARIGRGAVGTVDGVTAMPPSGVRRL